MCFTTTQPNLEPGLGTRTSATTFQQGSLYGAFPPASSLPGGPRLEPLSFSALAFKSHVAGSTLTWAALAVLIGAFYSSSTDFHHLQLPHFFRGKVGIWYNANLSLTIPNSRVCPTMEHSREYLPDHLFSTFTAPQPSQRPRDWGATVIVRKGQGS